MYIIVYIYVYNYIYTYVHVFSLSPVLAVVSDYLNCFMVQSKCENVRICQMIKETKHCKFHMFRG